MRNNNVISFEKRITIIYAIILIEVGITILTIILHSRHNYLLLLLILFVITDIMAVYFWIHVPFQTLKAMMAKASQEKTFSNQAFWMLPSFCQEERECLWFLCNDYNKNNTLKLAIRESELLALQTQINPHFLYNTLDAIRSDAIIEGNETIADIAESLGSYFRYSISSLDHSVTLNEELHNIKEYFKIQRYRFGDRIQWNIVWPKDNLEIKHYFIPKMILQPLVENAIFHGIEPKEGKGTITISMAYTDSKLYICVADDGIGMSDEETTMLNQSITDYTVDHQNFSRKKGHGIALRNVNQRLQLLYGLEYGIYLTSAKDFGSKAWVVLPIETFAENFSSKSYNQLSDNGSINSGLFF